MQPGTVENPPSGGQGGQILLLSTLAQLGRHPSELWSAGCDFLVLGVLNGGAWRAYGQCGGRNVQTQ